MHSSFGLLGCTLTNNTATAFVDDSEDGGKRVHGAMSTLGVTRSTAMPERWDWDAREISDEDDILHRI